MKDAKPPTKKPVRIVLDPKKHLDGYHLMDPSTTTRRVALLEAVEKDGKKLGSARRGLTAVQRRVRVLSIFFKRSKPVYSKRALADAAYLSSVREKI